MDELFVSIVEADNKFSRNISVGQIVVERPDRKTVKEVHVENFYGMYLESRHIFS